jgi:Recombinase
MTLRRLGTPCARDDCEYHRRLRLLRAIDTWSPFDPVATRAIAKYGHEGGSVDTIAARLNADGLHSPAGKKWSAQIVRALERVRGPEAGVETRPEIAANPHTGVAASRSRQLRRIELPPFG